MLMELNKYHNIYDAVKMTIQSLKGTYGLIIQSTIEPNTLYCVRNGSPLLVGKNDNCVIITSEQSGFCGSVMNYITLHNDDICIIQKNTNTINITTKQQYKNKQVTFVDQTLTPEPFKHWTLKEIYQQPQVALNVINNGGRIKNDREVKLGGLEQNIEQLKKINNIIILGCGTSFFAGLYGMYYFKELCHSGGAPPHGPRRWRTRHCRPHRCEPNHPGPQALPARQPAIPHHRTRPASLGGQTHGQPGAQRVAGLP